MTFCVPVMNICRFCSIVENENTNQGTWTEIKAFNWFIKSVIVGKYCMDTKLRTTSPAPKLATITVSLSGRDGSAGVYVKDAERSSTFRTLLIEFGSSIENSFGSSFASMPKLEFTITLLGLLILYNI